MAGQRAVVGTRRRRVMPRGISMMEMKGVLMTRTKHKNLMAMTTPKMEREGFFMTKINTNVVLLMIMVNILPGGFAQVCFRFSTFIVYIALSK